MVLVAVIYLMVIKVREVILVQTMLLHIYSLEVAEEVQVMVMVRLIQAVLTQMVQLLQQ